MNVKAVEHQRGSTPENQLGNLGSYIDGLKKVASRQKRGNTNRGNQLLKSQQVTGISSYAQHQLTGVRTDCFE